jgi:NAD(P)-dependent dehydrogenase (short-subunit alcohol dehydrogenase family)
MSLRGKSVLVTGGARGIGLACARRFVGEGCKVVVSDIDEQGGADAVEELTADGGEARFIACDTGDTAQVEAMVEVAAGHFDGIDVLINNAGIMRVAEFLDVAEEDFDAVIRVNVKGCFFVGQAVARRMVAQGRGGAIVNMASVVATLATTDTVPYVVSKGGVKQLTKGMALALAPHDIRVNAVGPGTIKTELAGMVMRDDRARRTILSRTPIGRLGEPDDIASVVVFLAGDDARYVTGQTVYADGGRLALNFMVPVAD